MSNKRPNSPLPRGRNNNSDNDPPKQGASRKKGSGDKDRRPKNKRRPGKPASPGKTQFFDPTTGLKVLFDRSRDAILEQPPCARDREADLEEVRSMLENGETEIAVDELLYLIADCRGFLEAYVLLGELALEEEDWSLAKGYFGFAYESFLAVLPAGFRTRIPLRKGDNRHAFASGRGLAICMAELGNLREGLAILDQLIEFDDADFESVTLRARLMSPPSDPGLPILGSGDD